MSTTETALTAHVVINDGFDQNKLIEEISETMFHKFKIGHTTIQIEDVGKENCNHCN